MKNKFAITFFSALIILSGLFLIRCARPGTPTGGPKDVAPPDIISSSPPDRTVNFTEKSITITFKEFIQLKDPAKEIFISPPMRLKPEYKVQGKKVVIEFQEELKENTTYTLNFGNSIVDFTESNILVNFEYVFSTGGHIDSLSIPGKVLNAFNHQPEPDIIAMVYRDENDTIPLDSLPLRVPPVSASKTTKDGSFRINNLSAGEYKLFALEDLNNNYIFDLPNERIAFLDSLIRIEPREMIVIPADSIDTTLMADTVNRPVIEDSYTLYLFEEIDSTQKLISKKLVGNSLLQYIFRMPADSITITPVGFQPVRPDWYITEFGFKKDTVNFWLRPGLPDTIRVRISAGDSLIDTTRFIISSSTPEKPGRRKEAAVSKMKVSSNVAVGSFDLNKSLKLFFSSPVKDYNKEKLILISSTDTINPLFIFTDTLRKQGYIEQKWLPDAFYQLIIEDSAFCDLNESYNDSTSVSFKVRTPEDYGILLLNVTLPDTSGQYIIQLMSEKEIIIQEYIVTHSGMIRFEFLKPGKYLLKAIFDTNSNSKWDIGKFGQNQLPEKVEYYTPALVIRANWDLQEEWKPGIN